MELSNVRVFTKANVFFDGKCVSHTVFLADGSRKSVGVLLPSTLRFDVSTPERMEVVDGTAHVSIAGGPEEAFGPGTSWTVDAGSYFVVRSEAAVHYVCHFG